MSFFSTKFVGVNMVGCWMNEILIFSPILSKEFIESSLLLQNRVYDSTCSYFTLKNVVFGYEIHSCNLVMYINNLGLSTTYSCSINTYVV